MSNAKQSPREFLGNEVIAYMRVPSTPDTMKHQAVILCVRSEEGFTLSYTVHHIGANSLEENWFGVAGVYDLGDVYSAWEEFQLKLMTYGALPPF